MPITKKTPVPKFQSEEEERQFWSSHDSTQFIDWRTATPRKFPNLKPTLRTISLRLPVSMIEDFENPGQQTRRALPIAPKSLSGGQTKERAAPHLLIQYPKFHQYSCHIFIHLHEISPAIPLPSCSPEAGGSTHISSATAVPGVNRLTSNIARNRKRLRDSIWRSDDNGDVVSVVV